MAIRLPLEAFSRFRVFALSRRSRQEGLPKGVQFETEQQVLENDGKYRWFLSRYNPLKDE
jgi:hypothetical protein